MTTNADAKHRQYHPVRKVGWPCALWNTPPCVSLCLTSLLQSAISGECVACDGNNSESGMAQTNDCKPGTGTISPIQPSKSHGQPGLDTASDYMPSSWEFASAAAVSAADSATYILLTSWLPVAVCPTLLWHLYSVHHLKLRRSEFMADTVWKCHASFWPWNVSNDVVLFAWKQSFVPVIKSPALSDHSPL